MVGAPGWSWHLQGKNIINTTRTSRADSPQADVAFDMKVEVIMRLLAWSFSVSTQAV